MSSSSNSVCCKSPLQLPLGPLCQDWHESLPEKLREILPDDLWKIVDDFRDRIWACTALKRFERRQQLNYFISSLAASCIVDGVMVVASMENWAAEKEEDDESKSTHVPPLTTTLTANVLEAFVSGGFSVENVVILPANPELGYDVHMNRALDELGGRCRFFLEIQTSERIKNEGGESGRRALLAELDRHPNAISFTVRRRHLFRVHHSLERMWRCRGGAHSFVELNELRIRSESEYFLPCTVMDIVFAPGHTCNRAAEHMARCLDRDVVASERCPTSNGMCRSVGERARFYLLQMKMRKKLDNHPAIKLEVMEECQQLLRRRRLGYAYAYIVTMNLVNMLIDDATRKRQEGQAFDVAVWTELTCLALDGLVFDRQRYEVLTMLMSAIVQDHAIRALAADDICTSGVPSLDYQNRTEWAEKDRMAVFARLIEIASPAFLLVDDGDPTTCRVRWTPGREPLAESKRLLAETGGAEPHLRFMWHLARFLDRTQSRTSYGIARTAMLEILGDPFLDSRSNDARLFANLCADIFPEAYPPGTPLPQQIRDICARPDWIARAQQ